MPFTTTGLVIGGETAAARNVLSAVSLIGANGALVQGNLIGLNATGTADLGSAAASSSTWAIAAA